jgi:hypothetical protein
VEVRTWQFEGSGLFSPEVAVLVPAPRRAGERFPVVLAFHGRGEALKDPKEGALGWPRDYGLVAAMERAWNPPLQRQDFPSFVTDDYVAGLNRQWQQQPFRGLVMVCPYVSEDHLRNDNPGRSYGSFLQQQLLPRVHRELPALTGPGSLGVDGISMGGAFALRLGLGRPDLFGAVSALQAAISESQANDWVERARRARALRPDLRLRLVTSEADGFRRSVQAVSEAWSRAGISHDKSLVPGPHNYEFNRGPGSFELLRWHDAHLFRPGP